MNAHIHGPFDGEFEDYWYIPKQIILLGPPGSGKTTLATELAKEYNAKIFSPGAVLREDIAAQTDLGKQVEGIVSRGELVSDDIMQQLVINHMDRYHAVYIFDNFPRSATQAQFLREYLSHNDIVVIRLDISDELADERIAGRSSVTQRTDDLNPEVIQRRRDLYDAELTEVCQILTEDTNHYFSVDVDGKSIIEILSEIKILIREVA